MVNPQVFLITTPTTSSWFEHKITSEWVPNARGNVHIFTVPETHGTIQTERESYSVKISDEIATHPINKRNVLFIYRDSAVSLAAMQKEWETLGYDNSRLKSLSIKKLRQEFITSSKEFIYHWKTHANEQLNRFEGPKISIDGWIQQFNQLGMSNLGKQLLMRTEVVKTSDFNDLFKRKRADLIGQKTLHCYVSDNDAGGSWVAIKDHLTHHNPPDEVVGIHWKKEAAQIALPSSACDQIIIYEDGLWSGSETLKRLNAIKEANYKRPIKFKFAIVTDFGLMFIRQAIRKLDLFPQVQIDASDSEVRKFLIEDLPEPIISGEGFEIGTYFSELHNYVRPKALVNCSDWPQDEYDHKNNIEDLCYQLIDGWLFRKNGTKPTPDMIDRYLLGGGNFASTTVFSKSVPKVCLPLFWLDGEVKSKSKTVQWKPLFIDPRRVGNKDLLLKE